MQDLVEHCLDFFDLDRTSRSARQARRAVVTAYRDLPTLSRWSFYKRNIELITEPSQQFTAIFDFTGGVYERQLEISSGTWPTNAARGRVIIDGVSYRIDERKSATVVTL